MKQSATQMTMASSLNKQPPPAADRSNSGLDDEGPQAAAHRRPPAAVDHPAVTAVDESASWSPEPDELVTEAAGDTETERDHDDETPSDDDAELDSDEEVDAGPPHPPPQTVFCTGVDASPRGLDQTGASSQAPAVAVGGPAWGSSTPPAAVTVTAERERARRRLARSRERRATVVLGIVMASFVGCWLPFFLVYPLSLLLQFHVPAPASLVESDWQGMTSY